MKCFQILTVILVCCWSACCFAQEKKSNEKPWMDLEHCAFCKNMSSQPGLMEHMKCDTIKESKAMKAHQHDTHAEAGSGAQDPTKSEVIDSIKSLDGIDNVETLATFKFDMSRRESSKWIEINGVSVPVDHSVEAEGVRIYLSLMFDIIAVDAKTEKVIWHLDWNKSMPIWETVSIVKLAQEGKEPRLAVELRRQGSEDSNSFRYRDLQWGTKIGDFGFYKADENDDWGPELEGLQTRLTLLSTDLAVGKPLKVRYEVRNVSDQAKSYDPQTVFAFRVLSVTGPDGKPDSYIGGSFQTVGGPTPIKSGETQTLFDNVDSAELFLMGSAGTYKLKCRAAGGGLGGDRTISLHCREQRNWLLIMWRQCAAR